MARRPGWPMHETYPDTPTPVWPKIGCDQTGERSWVWRTIFEGVKYQIKYEAFDKDPAWSVVFEQVRCWSELVKCISEKAKAR